MPLRSTQADRDSINWCLSSAVLALSLSSVWWFLEGLPIFEIKVGSCVAITKYKLLLGMGASSFGDFFPFGPKYLHFLTEGENTMYYSASGFWDIPPKSGVCKITESNWFKWKLYFLKNLNLLKIQFLKFKSLFKYIWFKSYPPRSMVSLLHLKFHWFSEFTPVVTYYWISANDSKHGVFI